MLNSEMGVLIESPRIATALAGALDGRALAHEVRPDGAGGLEWHETTSDLTVVVHRRAPHASLARRDFVPVASWLPLEWLLRPPPGRPPERGMSRGGRGRIVPCGVPGRVGIVRPNGRQGAIGRTSQARRPAGCGR